MTPEERAARFGQEYWPGYILENFDPVEMESAIAAAIRDAVEEGTKDARNATGMENWRLRAIQAEALNAIYQTRLDTTREQAFTALEPFARLAGTHSARLVPPKELVDARDAYLALGGKIE